MFHLASLFIAEHKEEDVIALIDSNMLFGAMLAEAMNVCGCRRLINAGTSWQHYGEGSRDPVCLYAATKNAFEEILRYYVAAEGFRVTTLKLFDSYGPDDHRPKLIPKLLNAFGKDLKIELSPGEQQLDLVHISDIVRAFELAALRQLHEAGARSEGNEGLMDDFAVSSGAPVSLRSLIGMIEIIKGQSLDIAWGTRPYRRREVMRPWESGERLPEWRAEISLDQGLRELIYGSPVSEGKNANE